MHTHVSPALEKARSINSKRLFVLFCFVGVLGVVRLFAYPVPDSAFVMLAFWMLAGLLYDFGMKKAAQIIRPQLMQVAMFAFDITLLTVAVAVA